MGGIELETIISASPAAVYQGWTLPNLISHWLSESARAQVREGGPFTLMWNSGHWAAGVYSTVEADKRLAFSWHEAGSPGTTHIEVRFVAVDGGTRVSLTQTGFGEGEAWDAYREASERNWREMLDNLRVLLETANDARFLRRPVAGMGIIPISAEEAAAKGLPVDHGLNVTVVVKGGAAEQAGLRQGDYVTAVDGTKQSSFGSFNAVLGRHKAGNAVEVKYYRGGELYSTTLTFGQRQPQHTPETREDLYEAVEKQVSAVEAELDVLFAGVPEKALNVKPAPHEWNAKEVLAHLIWAERWFQMSMWLMITAGTRPDWGFNNDFEIGGIAETRETAAELLNDLKQSLREQLHSVRHIPDQTLAVKPIFAEVAGWLCHAGEHCREHYEQIKATIVHAQEQAVIPA
jgi:uncharacterized protein YndB with AHSA1/START domain